MLNANIPLNTHTTIRQPHWRIGLFFGFVMLGITFGWQGIKIITTGVTIPKIIDASGITIRTTPTNTLWLATHTAGLSINANCPIDIPTLLSYKTTTWVTIGDVSQELQLHITGSMSESLQNLHSAFSCNTHIMKKGYTLQTSTTTSETKSFISFFTPDAWAWTEKEATKIDLYSRGLNILIKQRGSKKVTWPEQNLTSALPIASFEENNLPETMQGLTVLLKKNNETITFFTWKSEQGSESAFVFPKKLTDDEILALFSTFTHTNTTKETVLRNDNIKYTAIKQESLILTWKNEETGELYTEDGDIRGYVTRNNEQTRLNTAQTAWIQSTPSWRAERTTNTTHISHVQRTLTMFGEEIFVTKKMVTLFQKEM